MHAPLAQPILHESRRQSEEHKRQSVDFREDLWKDNPDHCCWNDSRRTFAGTRSSHLTSTAFRLLGSEKRERLLACHGSEDGGEFLFFPLLPREASKRVHIFDRGTGSKPERHRLGSLQADLSLIVLNDPPARIIAQAPRFFAI